MATTVTDQMGRNMTFQKTPQRIISLVPSQTELLVELGLTDKLVGITKFCIHPKGLLNEKTVIGGTKQFRFEVIDTLKPDLIIGNKEENYQEGIEILEKKYPVWMSDIFSLADAYEMMESIGKLVGKEKEAQAIIQKIQMKFQQIPELPKRKALYFIWRKPYMLAGENTFIDHIMKKANLMNCVNQDRYPALEEDELRKLKPDTVLLSSEPYPFKAKHIAELKAVFPNAKVQLVDGELFSWYGSRLLQTPAYLQKLLVENRS